MTEGNKKYKSLAIVGNGFDLAHGYRTTFFDFVEKTTDKDLDVFRQFCINNNIITWHNFEENIKLMTINFWNDNFVSGCNYDEISGKIEKLNHVFSNIHNLLRNYLKTELSRFEGQKKRNVAKYLNLKTKVITFNYTNLAEIYTKDIFHVHGSVDEGKMLLGYDYREEPCLISMEYMYWYKNFRRELLAFQRYLEYEECLKDSDPNYKMLVENFEKYQMCANSGRGIDEEVKDEIIEFDKINDFICNKCKNMVLPDIDYGKIKTVILLGHGLESDEEFLKEMLKKMTKLKKVIVFRYAQESDVSLNKKIVFLKQYCQRVLIKTYD